MSHHTKDPICPLCQEKLATVESQLRDWFNQKVKPLHPEAHVSCGYRDEADQEKAFEEGRSKLHYPHSAHNKVPAQAIDLFQLDDNGVALWRYPFFASLNDYNDQYKIPLKWGGLFRDLGDADHFQLG